MSTIVITVLLAAACFPACLSLGETEWVSVSRCRASCLDTLVSEAPEMESCHHNSDCYMCWEMCERLLADTVSWGPMCDNDNALICVSIL